MKLSVAALFFALILSSSAQGIGPLLPPPSASDPSIEQGEKLVALAERTLNTANSIVSLAGYVLTALTAGLTILTVWLQYKGKRERSKDYNETLKSILDRIGKIIEADATFADILTARMMKDGQLRTFARELILSEVENQMRAGNLPGQEPTVAPRI